MSFTAPNSPASRRARTAFAFALLACGAAAAGGQDEKPAADASAPVSHLAPSYKIGPADVLQIVVWREAELTRDVEVRLDGMITLPLLGELQAAGRTPSELADTLSKALGKYVETPKVTVGVSRANSARFYIIGQVARSGEFPLTGRTTVLQGLALAGGFREFAKTESIVIVRPDQTPIQINYKRIAEGKDVSQNVLLAPGDTVVVP
jgi:polysaccharide export outer membrane protein